MSTAAPLQTQAAKPQPLSSSTPAGLLLQRKCACGSPTSSLTGKCAECKSTQRLQTKLSISASNDPLEQEADRVADQILAAPAHSAVSHAAARIQRFTGQGSGQADTVPASVDRVLASPGSPLGPALRQDMEHRFGYDFSRVRVHSGTPAEQSAQDVSAHAYTVGHDIVFGASRFAPGSDRGRRLLAHELSHVVQQGGGSRKPGEARSSLSASPGGYAQRQPQIPKFSESTEDQIAALMDEHPRLSRANAERAVQGPQGASPQASGKGGTRVTGTGSGNLPKVADIEFRQSTARGSSVVLRREVKTWEGNQGSFNAAVSNAADKLQAGGGGELLVQVPEGTDARKVVQRFKGSVIESSQGVQKFGRYRSIKITIVNPSGTVLLDEPLEFPPSKIPPAAGGPSGAATTAQLPKGSVFETTPPLPKGSVFETKTPPLPKGSVFETKTPPLPKGAVFETTTPPLPKGSVFETKTPPQVGRVLKTAMKTAAATARRAARSSAFRAVRSAARSVAGKAIRALPLIGALLALKSAKDDVDKLKRVNTYVGDTGLEKLPSPKELREEHVWLENVDEETTWLQENAGLTLIAWKSGRNTKENSEAIVILGRALSAIAEHVEELGTAESWNTAYAEELRPLHEQIKEHQDLAHGVMNGAWESAKKVENIPLLLDATLAIHRAASEVAERLGGLESELGQTIRAYDAMAQACREERQAAVETYNWWYRAYNNTVRERLGIEEDLGAGTLELPE